MTPDLRLVAAAVAPVPAAGFAEAMSTLASGVVLVTCRVDGRPWGMTVSAFASVSAAPPTILVSLRSDGTSAAAIAATRSFGVSILAADQVDVARYGAAPGAAKFLESLCETNDAPGASPAVAGALAHLDCELAEAVEVADHIIFVGRVLAARASDEDDPLLYHRRAYRTLAEPDRAATPTERSLGCLSS